MSEQDIIKTPFTTFSAPKDFEIYKHFGLKMEFWQMQERNAKARYYE